MKRTKLSKIGLIGIAILILGGIGRSLYFGSVSGSCIYSEDIRELKPEVAAGEIILVKPVSVVEEAPQEYHCLQLMGSIHRRMEPGAQAPRSSSGQPISVEKVKTLDPSSSLTFKPVQIVKVTKHGITTMDSGSGPIDHLILRGSDNEIYQVPVVYLGINDGEEFLKLQTANGEVLLNAESSLSQ